MRKVFQVSLQQYVNMKVRNISVHAWLTGGGYALARAGFVGIGKEEVEQILNNARKQLSPSDFTAVENIYDKFYSDNPDGKAFPMKYWAMYEPKGIPTISAKISNFKREIA
jgi:hypothetical protein